MSTDKSSQIKGEANPKIDMSFEILIEHAESEIKAYRKKVDDLSKSFILFEKQVKNHIPFPMVSRDKRA